MKKYFLILTLAILSLGIFPACAQIGETPGVPQFGNGMDKLFGDNQTFSATLQMQMDNGGNPIAMSGKMSFDKGSSRFEMNLSDMKGGSIPPDAAAQLKTMGLDRMVSITQSDKKVVYVIYPDAQSYSEMTPATSDAGATNADSKIEITQLGNETIDGHACAKNKAVVTDKQGAKHAFTVWNATDLKNFPVKIQMNEQGSATMTFKDIGFSKPDASLFVPPTGYTKYDSMPEMMQAVMMKKMGGMGLPQPPAGQ
jgi:outer membrane lipoprotein-sorting protein